MTIFDNNFVGFKIEIYPTVEQIKIIQKCFGASRYAYNFAINLQNETFMSEGKYLSEYDVRNAFNKHRKDIHWLQEVQTSTTSVSIFDAVKAMNFFRRKINRFPNFKTKKSIHQSAPIRPERMTIAEKYIRIPGIGKVEYHHLPNKCLLGNGDKNNHMGMPFRHYYNARMHFDGYKYYITLEMHESDDAKLFSLIKRPDYEIQKQTDISIGIDVGFKGTNWIVDSTNTIVELPNVEKERKKIKKFQRKYSRQLKALKTKKSYDMNADRTNNMNKTISEINKYHQRIRNKRVSRLYDYISHNIIDKRPKRVVIEDLNVKSLLIRENPNNGFHIQEFNSKIYEAGINEFQNILKYKCEKHGIQLIRAHKHFPSTQRCSNCGNIQPIGKKRIYRCSICGMVENRDKNAAKNLSTYYTPILFV